MRKLIQGIVNFRKNLTKEKKDTFAKLAFEQFPDALFIACCDSRVVPNLVVSTDPGDLFVLRNIGNLVPPVSAEENSVSSAIEFSIRSLNVSDIIVCGHSECGAMKALTKDIKDCPHVCSWLTYGQRAKELVEQGKSLNLSLPKHDQISQINVLLQMAHLSEYPFVQEQVKRKKLRVHGWWFDIAKADVYCYEKPLDKFVLIDENEAKSILERLNY